MQTLQTPILNDPFAIVWEAFKRLYPDKEVGAVVWSAPDEESGHAYSETRYKGKGSAPIILLYDYADEVENGFSAYAEIFAHELAHVAVGPDADHDDARAAFEAIWQLTKWITIEKVLKMLEEHEL